jgi:transcription antitermination factor NusG
MQKNWYIIYTKPKWERKVTAKLKKRKIENFLPLHYKQITSFRRTKTQEEPLFQSYVFANVTENEIFKLISVDGVVNVVYWKGEPAKIKDAEIEIIKDFISDHQDITIEKIKVNENDVARVIDGSRYSISGNILTIKNTVAKVKLPSMGFTLVAKVGTVDPKVNEMIFGEKDLLLQS